jgi:hypothetical protein
MIKIGRVTIKTKQHPKLIQFTRVMENGESHHALFTIACTQVIPHDDTMIITYTRTA